MPENSRRIERVENLARGEIMQTTFAEVLETIENFTVDEKETLVDILQHRLRENKRLQIVKSVKESRREFNEGNSKPVSVDEIMKGILS